MSFHLIFEFDCDCQFFIYLITYLLFLCFLVVQIEYFSGVFQTWASSSRSWRFFYFLFSLVLGYWFWICITLLLLLFSNVMCWSMFVSFINCPFKLVDFGSHRIVWCPFFKISDLYTTHIETKDKPLSTTMLQISKHIRIVSSLLTCSNNVVTWDLHLYC